MAFRVDWWEVLGAPGATVLAGGLGPTALSAWLTRDPPLPDGSRRGRPLLGCGSQDELRSVASGWLRCAATLQKCARHKTLPGPVAPFGGRPCRRRICLASGAPSSVPGHLPSTLLSLTAGERWRDLGGLLSPLASSRSARLYRTSLAGTSCGFTATQVGGLFRGLCGFSRAVRLAP